MINPDSCYISCCISKEDVSSLSKLVDEKLFFGKKLEFYAKIFKFDYPASNSEIIKVMESAGYRPANLIELLALEEAEPDLFKLFSIAALGQVCKTSRGHYFPYVQMGIDELGPQLELCLLSFPHLSELEDIVFLAVRK